MHKAIVQNVVETSSYIKTNKVDAIEPANPYSLLLLNSKVTLLVIL